MKSYSFCIDSDFRKAGRVEEWRDLQRTLGQLRRMDEHLSHSSYLHIKSEF